jgi:DNA-binding HxlR family transcriptional regulator
MQHTPTEQVNCLQVEDRPGCVQAALNILGDKWSPLLLGLLVQDGKTFSELESSLTGISPRTLSARLDHLVDKQIIEKLMYCQHPPRYRYQLSQKGIELQGILRAMGDWGNKYHA